MRRRGVPGNHGRWVLSLAFCLLVVSQPAGQDVRAFAKASIPACQDEEQGVSSWEEVLQWRMQADAAPWACPWCGKRDNMSWAFRCRRCGYLACNPGGYLLRPVDTAVVTGGYSPGHKAVDFGAREGSPVFAAGDGVVVEARKDRWAGNILRIRHEGGLQTVYAHLREIRAAPGCFVRMGEVIAWSGSTGVSTGPHLHFEVLLQGQQVDPFLLLGVGPR